MGQEFDEIYRENARVVMKFLLSMTNDYHLAGEMFAELEAKMQEKWSIGEDVRVVWEDGFWGCTIRDMNLCLVDEDAMYRVSSYYAYREEVLTVEVRRLEHKQSAEAEKLFRWSALVDCMETLDYDLTDDSDDISFIFHFNENMEQYPKLTIGGEKEEEEWLYEKGELRRCDEEIQIEGNGKYYYLLLLSIHSVRDEDGDWRAEVPEVKGLYIDME